MYYVYILKSIKTNGKYIGYTSDLKRRFAEHNRGKVKSTRKNKPYELICYEAFKDKRDATREEKLFKTGQGRRILKTKLVYS